MIPYSVYKIIHLVGILMVFISMGGVLTHVINGGTRNHPWRKALAITHGIGLFLSLLGGFGLLARIGNSQDGLPGWIIAKLVIWTIFAILMTLTYRKAQLARPVWILIMILGALAAYLAGSKPF